MVLNVFWSTEITTKNISENVSEQIENVQAILLGKSEKLNEANNTPMFPSTP